MDQFSTNDLGGGHKNGSLRGPHRRRPDLYAAMIANSRGCRHRRRLSFRVLRHIGQVAASATSPIVPVIAVASGAHTGSGTSEGVKIFCNQWNNPRNHSDPRGVQDLATRGCERVTRLMMSAGDGEDGGRPPIAVHRPGGTMPPVKPPVGPPQPATLGDVLYAKSKPPVSEQDWHRLVTAIASGDQGALYALYDRAHRVVFTLALRITSNQETAEELTVDVFHDVWRRASAYDPANGTVLGWIMNQARSRAIDRLRRDNRKKRADNGLVDPLPEAEPDPSDILALRERGESLRAALAHLTPDERMAIETTFFSDLTYAEAAERLNQPLGTLKTRIRSGLHKLRTALTRQGGTP